VAFERDYALRANKPVFGYDPETRSLFRDSSPPLELHVVPLYWCLEAGKQRASEILEFMQNDRFIVFTSIAADEELAVSLSGLNFMRPLVPDAVRRITARGGYVLVFASADGDMSVEVRHFIEAIAHLQRENSLVAYLDRLPYMWRLLVNRVNRTRPTIVQLYGDRQRSATQRVDDLIVCLYWLIYRKTRHTQLT
jgi:hypothetical protein